MSSHRAIHYGLRPAKNIERKMICEAIQRLAHFENIHNYRYIGFGSRYFSDFSLIHRTLGIHQMISIEKDTNNVDWFDFNKPYKCIEALYGHSNAVLPRIEEWEKIPTILWLDYDGELEKNVFIDIELFCSSARPGSIILITVNADTDKTYLPFDQVLEKFKVVIGESRVPNWVKGKNLSRSGKPKVLKEIITNV